MKDSKIEGILQREKYQFAYRAKVTWSEIDWRASEGNPGRLDRRLDPEQVESYALAMIDGHQFPAAVLLDGQGDGLVVADGVHRLKAAQMAERDGFDAYIIPERDAYRREELSRRLNMFEGRGLSAAQRVQAVLDLHEKYGKPLKDLAARWCVKLERVRNAHRANRADTRARSLHLSPLFVRLSQTSKVTLQRLRHDPIFVAAADVVLTYELQGHQVEDLIDHAAAAASDGEALALIAERRKELEEAAARRRAKGTKVPQPKATLFFRRARQLDKFLGPGPVGSQLDLPTLARRMEMRGIAASLATRLREIVEELDAIEAWTKSNGDAARADMAAAPA
jgi:hypothetical protein